jgi:hypothetical protein
LILNLHGMRRRNIIAAVALIVLALGYGVLTSQLPVRSLPDTPGPPFFPWINTAILLALSLALLVQGLIGTSAEKNGQAVSTGTAEQRWQATWALGAFLVYLVILPGFGFLLATAPFFAVLMVLFNEPRPVRVAVGSIAMTVSLYILFRHGFNVFLPRGVVPDLITGLFA